MAELYDCCDNENLQHADPDDAVEEYLDGCEPEFWPAVLHVQAYDHLEISEGSKERLAEMVLEHLHESLCEDFAGDDWPEPTKAMGTAARAFVDAVVPDFHVWQCARVPREDEHIPVAAWVRDQHPEWIDESPAVAEWIERAEADIQTGGKREGAGA